MNYLIVVAFISQLISLYYGFRWTSIQTSPILTVVIPCFNCERWLNETLVSLQAQTFTDFSVILIDDGSAQPIQRATLYYTGDLQVRRHWKNLGLSAARNTGAMLARRSKYIAFLDPDDMIEPVALERLLLKMKLEQEENANVAFVYPATVSFQTDHGSPKKRNVIQVSRQPYSKSTLLNSNYIPSFALIDRAVYMRAGGMCQDHIKWWEDYDFWLRLGNLGWEGVLLDEPLFWYRRHGLGRSSHITRNVPKEVWHEEVLRANPTSLNYFDDEYWGRDLEAWLPPCYFALRDDWLSVNSRFSPWLSIANRWIRRKRVPSVIRLEMPSS